MTDRATPSPDTVPEVLDDSGVAAGPALVSGLQDIAALGVGPAPQASAELARLMADGGRAQQGRRNKKRITFIGGALAVSMGVGISGVAAGTLHLTDGLGTAVDSVSRFRAADAADARAERAQPPSVVVPADDRPVGTPIAPVPSPSAVPAPPGGVEETAGAPAAGPVPAAAVAAGPRSGQVAPPAPRPAPMPGPVDLPAPVPPAVGEPRATVEEPEIAPRPPAGQGAEGAQQATGGQAERAKGGQDTSRRQGRIEQGQIEQGRIEQGRRGQRDPGRAPEPQDTRPPGGRAPDARMGQAEDPPAAPADRNVSRLRSSGALPEDPVFLSAPDSDDVWLTLFLGDAEVVASDDTTDTATTDDPVIPAPVPGESGGNPSPGPSDGVRPVTDSPSPVRGVTDGPSDPAAEGRAPAGLPEPALPTDLPEPPVGLPPTR